MFSKTKAAVIGLVAAAGFAAPAANAALTSQGVTFTQTYISSSSYSLTITGLLDATGNWANVNAVQSIGIKGFGAFTTATVDPLGAFSGNELNANFCSGGVSGGACFTWNPVLAASNDMTFIFTFTGANITEDMTPHIKVAFRCPNDNNACGDLLSRDVGFGDDDDDDDDTDMPEPGTLALLGLGLLGLGMSRRRKV